MSDIAELEVEAPGAGPHDVEVRSATALEVRFAERMIDIVAVPYGETTQVMYHGRMIDETVERGAFEGVQMRSRDFKVNRAHDPERPIGWVRKFKPRDDRGLIAEIGPLRPTRDGDDALELAADGLLGASVGFMVMRPADERWSVDRRSRTISKAWLDHIALTGAPAYPGAKVLSVRSAVADDESTPGSATPNLDGVLAWLLAERYSSAQP
jgi:HK97 family phage prohead protease